ncbi:MAG TPA: hypothetical protein VK661_11050 [Planctomycetota bacterium]|nr:hypothetical protein [Planctomycetota bacterium]
MMHRTIARRAPPAILSWVAALLFAAAGTAAAQDAPTGSWSAKAGGDNFFLGGAASDGTYLYVAGGYQEGVSESFPDVYRRLRRYDPANDSWMTLADLSFAVYSNAVACHGGRLFSFGGSDFTVGATDAIQAYDIAGNTWSVLGAHLTSARSILAAATLGDRIYVMGGYSSDFSADNDEFNPTNDSVTARTAMPAALIYHTLTAVPATNRIYAVSGFDAAGPVAANYEYAPGDDSWTPRASMQDAGGIEQPRYGAASFGLLNRVYVTGGFFDTSESVTWEYNPAADAWARRADMANARYLHGAAAVGDKGYVYGGSASGAFTTGEEFSPGVLPPPPPSNQDPIANAGPDQTVEATGPGGASVTLNGTGSSDPEGASLTYAWTGSFGSASGATPSVSLPLGENHVSLTVSDPDGGSASDTVTIMVVDSTPPAIVNLCANPNTLWSPNHDMRQVSVSASAGDAADAAPVCQIISVSSNQAVSSGGDWQITGAMTLNLRAERTGGDSRIYTITVRCTDASGNSSSATVTVTVPHSQGNNSGDASSQSKAKKK